MWRSLEIGVYQCTVFIRRNSIHAFRFPYINTYMLAKTYSFTPKTLCHSPVQCTLKAFLRQASLYFVARFVPESVRWLRVNERLEEAEKILHDAAKVNGRPKPTVRLSKAKTETKCGTYADLFRTWPMCKATLIQSYAW